MRRLSALLIALALGLLVACGSTPAANVPSEPTASAPAEATSAPAEATSAAPTAAAPAGAETRTITDANGVEIEVPADPQRIVAIVQEDLDVLLALGVMPVGVANGQGQTAPPVYLADQVGALPNIGAMNSPNIEAIAALNPDLILIGDMSDEYMADVLGPIRQIAPAVNTMVWGGSWKEHLLRVGEVVNRQDAAAQVLADYESKVEEVKQALGENAGATVSIVRWNADGPSYMQKNNFSSVVLADVGLVRPDTQQEEGFATSERLSMEQLDLLDADWLFIGTLSQDGDDVTALDTALQSPLFQQLEAVKQGHVVPIDGAIWGTLGGPQAALHILTDVEQALGGE